MKHEGAFVRVLRAGALTAALLVFQIGYGEDFTQDLEGTWKSSGEKATTLIFYGNQVGSKIGGGAEKCFKYTSGTGSELILNFGTESQTVTAEIENNNLTIADDKGISTVYQKTSTFTNTCQKGMLQLDAARKLCKQADPKLTIVALPETLEYLQEIPECPNGGIYMIQPNQSTACSLNCGKEGGAK